MSKFNYELVLLQYDGTDVDYIHLGDFVDEGRFRKIPTDLLKKIPQEYLSRPKDTRAAILDEMGKVNQVFIDWLKYHQGAISLPQEDSFEGKYIKVNLIGAHPDYVMDLPMIPEAAGLLIRWMKTLEGGRVFVVIKNLPKEEGYTPATHETRIKQLEEKVKMQEARIQELEKIIRQYEAEHQVLGPMM